VASRIPLSKEVNFVPEINSRISVVSNTLDTKELPVEGLIALKYAINALWLVSAGSGLSIGRGYNAPDWRIFLGISTSLNRRSDQDCDGIMDTSDQCPLTPEDRDQFKDQDGCPDPDNDQDKILDLVDSCPLEPEDKDQFQDQDGCPDPDNDQDGILDTKDKCPLDPEDYDQFQDQDGCPDPDNDLDGIIDVRDKCPLEPEDHDQFQDQDGCPDPDNDQDQIPDITDRCPIDPENRNGFEDTDGCPDRQLVTVSCEKINFQGKIYFATAKAVIQRRSFPLLNEIAKMLASHPEIKRIRVEGHTDNRGSDAYNFRLSDARAASVLGFLAQKGISERRLMSKGFGESKPIASNRTRSGRAENRRVAFIILERSGCK
jgi:outer membrane protein OmpA-like peptidoglycan-associated protein